MLNFFFFFCDTRVNRLCVRNHLFLINHFFSVILRQFTISYAIILYIITYVLRDFNGRAHAELERMTSPGAPDEF